MVKNLQVALIYSSLLIITNTEIKHGKRYYKRSTFVSYRQEILGRLLFWHALYVYYSILFLP